MDAPLGTSGWFLGSMAQWDLYLRKGCEVSAVATPIDNDPEVGSGDTEDDTETEDVGGGAAYIEVPSTLLALGKPFAASGYDNPFLQMFYHEDSYYGFLTSTEVNKYYIWSILLDEESYVPDVDDYDPNNTEIITFTRFTKGMGLYIFPFLAF